MIFRSIFALGLGFAGSVSAQGSQDPLQAARSLDACNGAEILTARFDQPDVLAVRCGEPTVSTNTGTGAGTGILQGGLGTSAAIGITGLTVVILAASIGDSSSTSDTQ